MTQRTERPDDEECLTSRTYLNIRAVETLPGNAEGEMFRPRKSGYQISDRQEVVEELERLAYLSKNARYEEYLYLKGQWVVLYRLLHPRRSESFAGDIARGAWLGAGPVRELAEIFRENLQNVGDDTYLDFCDVEDLPPPWRVKTRGKVKPGNLVYCHHTKLWKPAGIDQWEMPVTEHFTADFDTEEIPR